MPFEPPRPPEFEPPFPPLAGGEPLPFPAALPFVPVARGMYEGVRAGGVALPLPVFRPFVLVGRGLVARGTYDGGDPVPAFRMGV